MEPRETTIKATDAGDSFIALQTMLWESSINTLKKYKLIF